MIPWEKRPKYRFGYPVAAVVSLAISWVFADAGPDWLSNLWLWATSVAFFIPAVCFAAVAWWAWTCPE